MSESNLLAHARREFRAAGWTNEDGSFKDDTQQAICRDTLALLALFASQGHSGMSAPYAVQMFSRLAMFEPLKPLTGEDWEWIDVGEGHYQNARCGRVFKDANRFGGNAYDIEAVIFFDWVTDEDGEKRQSCFTNHKSHRPIEFPYTPISEYRERPKED